MLAVKAVGDVLAARVQEVDDAVSVTGLAGCEDDDLELFVEVLEDLAGVGADVYTCSHY